MAEGGHRSVSREKYFLAAVITFLIFFLGLSLGMLMDNARVQSLQYDNKKQEADYKSLQFMYFLLGNLGEEKRNCDVLHTALDKTTVELADSLDEFTEYKKDTTLNKKEYELVGRRYLLDNIRYWFFATEVKNNCQSDLVPLLYFYSGEHCTECPNQGVVLTYFKKKYDEKLLIFPLDIDLEEEEPLIPLLKSRFNITVYPSIVVGDEKFEGVIGKGQLAGLICGEFVHNESCLA